jgi:hypothetical protein
MDGGGGCVGVPSIPKIRAFAEAPHLVKASGVRPEPELTPLHLHSAADLVAATQQEAHCAFLQGSSGGGSGGGMVMAACGRPCR